VSSALLDKKSLKYMYPTLSCYIITSRTGVSRCRPDSKRDSVLARNKVDISSCSYYGGSSSNSFPLCLHIFFCPRSASPWVESPGPDGVSGHHATIASICLGLLVRGIAWKTFSCQSRLEAMPQATEESRVLRNRVISGSPSFWPVLSRRGRPL